MTARRKCYKKKSKSIRAKKAIQKPYKKLVVKLKNKMVDIGSAYINFFKSLDNADKFKYYANSIVHNSKQWNNIHRKHITASEIKRLCSWTENTNYLYSYVTKYISGKQPNRGMILEDYIRKLVELNGYELDYCNTLWIYKHLLWLSCTTDAVIVKDNKLVALVEIKTFKSLTNLERTVNLVDGEYCINKQSWTYYQMQITAEIVDVPCIVFVYEYNHKINKILIERDLDFLWHIFERLKYVYLMHIVPYYLYGLKNVNFFGDR